SKSVLGVARMVSVRVPYSELLREEMRLLSPDVVLFTVFIVLSPSTSGTSTTLYVEETGDAHGV
ncbi:MAG: hypothetical protein QXG82_00980, partial [Sulfolobales archaeon]